MNVTQLSDYRSLGAKRAEARQRERLATAARLASSLASANRLSKDDSAVLARNVGRLSEERAAAKSGFGNAKAVLRRAFEIVAETKGLTEERWPKRLRWSRLDGELTQKEPLSGRGATYLELAKAIAAATEWDEAKAVIGLAEGTSFSPSIEAVAGEKVGATARQIAMTVATLADLSIPRARPYFETVERLGLIHPLKRRPTDGLPAISHFDHSTFILTPWDGMGVEGQLVAQELQDGDLLSQESFGSASLLPSVVFANITAKVVVPTVAFDDRPCTQEDDRAAFLRRAENLGHNEATVHDVVGQTFDAYLVLGPGESAAGSLRLGIVIEARDMTWSIGNDAYDAVEYRPAQKGPWRIFDVAAWDSDRRVELLKESEATIFWLQEGSVREILSLVGKPQEFAFTRSLIKLGDHEVEIVPAVKTGGFTEPDPRSLEGILDANVKYQSGESNVIHMLFEDARARISRLDQHLDKWRAEYMDATRRFEGLSNEP